MAQWSALASIRDASGFCLLGIRRSEFANFLIEVTGVWQATRGLLARALLSRTSLCAIPPRTACHKKMCVELRAPSRILSILASLYKVYKESWGRGGPGPGSRLYPIAGRSRTRFPVPAPAGDAHDVCGLCSLLFDILAKIQS